MGFLDFIKKIFKGGTDAKTTHSNDSNLQQKIDNKIVVQTSVKLDDVTTNKEIETNSVNDNISTNKDIETSSMDKENKAKFEKTMRSLQVVKEFEDLLQKAADQPEYRNEFYLKLITSDLVIITRESELPAGEQVLAQDTDIKIATLTDGTVPVFTSIPKIFDKGIIKENVSFTQINATELFRLTKGSKLFLNPFSDYGKELLPNEIERILDGSILGSNSATKEIQKDTKIQIGVPSVYPNEIIEEMNILFRNINTVKSAFVAWINVPISGEPAHYIFALDVDDNYRETVAEAGKIVEKYISKNGFADFIRLESKGGLSDYFINEATPFYQR